MHYDVIIVGQGVCGTFLSYYLLQQGKKVLVIDKKEPITSSGIASGVINPVTGRRIVTTWMVEEIMPFAVNAYKAMEQILNIKIIEQSNIIDFHTTPQMQLAFDNKSKEDNSYLLPINNKNEWRKWLNFPFGATQINPCWLIDLNSLIKHWQQYLCKQQAFIEHNFDETKLIIHQATNTIHYESWTAEKIIYCNGIAAAQSKYFEMLPFSPNKGEVLIVNIPDLPRKNMYKHGFTLVPWQNESLFWVGSTYEWQFDHAQPTPVFYDKANAMLNQFLTVPFTIEKHLAAIRPANIERRPFVGFHPIFSNMGMLNGMGTKGCSLAPFFANELTNNIQHNHPINAHADIKRFNRILSQQYITKN